MKYIPLAIIAGTMLFSSCAQSVPNISQYNGKSITMFLKAKPGAIWQFYIDGQLVMEKKYNVFEGFPVMNGTWKGKPIMVRMQQVSSGWSSVLTADVFISGQLVETLVVR